MTRWCSARMASGRSIRIPFRPACSLSAATPTPDPNVTPTPTLEPTPTPTPGPKTKLYYNKSGGKFYHADQNCSKVANQYLPLTGSFTYKDINKSPYDKLEPCDKCNPPARPSK